MSPVRTTALACLLASLYLLAPIAASASAAGGTAYRDSDRHVHSRICGHKIPQESPVPEPGALLVFSAGALVVGAALRSRTRR